MDDLQAILDTLRGPALVHLAAGDYHLRPRPYLDPACGNCQDPAEEVPATRGLRLTGTGLQLLGASPDATVLHTHAGYGVLFDGCDDCGLARLTVADGTRDADGRATSAAVVARGGAVTLRDCVLRDNLGDSAVVHSVVVGVAGVAVREDADVLVEGCRIEGNSWDGIAVYRGGRLTARHNVIDGVDKAAGASMGGGRGTGIGLTWNAEARIVGNRVTRYWKGIGVFGSARAEVAHNVVEDVLTWGMALWGPEAEPPHADFHGNVVFETGACGVILDGGTGSLRANLFVRTGQDARYDDGTPYCVQRPIARHRVPAGLTVADNLVVDARQPGVEVPLEPEADRATLVHRARTLLRHPDAGPALAGSRFSGYLKGVSPGGDP